MESMFFSEILKNNNILNEKLKNEDKLELKVLTNITLHQLKPVLEYSLNSNEIFSTLEIGEYDNIVKESLEIAGEIPIVFWELCNLSDSFVFEIESFDVEKVKRLKTKIIEDLNSIFKNLSGCKAVIFNKFSHLAYTAEIYERSNYQIFVEELNSYLIENKPKNFDLVEIDKLIAINSIEKCFNFRDYHNNKSLYTVKFFKSYAKILQPILGALSGRAKKCIVLDCDNTLWSGIIGEDGLSELKFGEDAIGEGKYFYFSQLLLKSLKEKGVLLCLASKNNYSDVEEFFLANKDKLKLNFNDYIVKKINWNNKHENIAQIAKELNVGLDSILFIDDSDFELNLVKGFLPDISTFQVPVNLFEYPRLLIGIKNLFYKKSLTKEDQQKHLMYRQNLKRDEKKSKYKDIDDYLKSLKIRIELSTYAPEKIERLSQLTLKTNQFNLSTKRYEITDLDNFRKAETNHLISMGVLDLFGDFGTTGLCLVKFESNFASVDTFMMSCRILGRKIEITFLHEILKFIFDQTNNTEYVVFRFTPSKKNKAIKDFLETTDSKLEVLDNGSIEYIFEKPTANQGIVHETVWINNS